MAAAEIEQVRRFNRTVTQRIGALSDRFMARDRPLGEARVLWEIGPAGCEVRTLRNRLELDSGQLSRVLRSLEAANLVRIEPSPADRRIRIATPTKAGLAERAVLDRRSDRLAADLSSRWTQRRASDSSTRCARCSGCSRRQPSTFGPWTRTHPMRANACVPMWPS